ncbi:SDR family NAD(P)-dependent oxidoreductase [Sulfitobacter albidus]|uniref:SDR family NAD(P)-dependent oxidoreductase n=1 Tax=Sulfitobacter albidus TaxID=2829501 RepID=A0A975PP26_9RHOB|nr:SDR family NAD(P)-dependent oxidoreductase [Sulfitobacter albidus]QUJ78423.1 SDR family NAD(P)-dependent oxidoreductase [Sulfitobacter albidus]
MTDPLVPPPRKDPQKRSVSPTRPPEWRSRAAMGLTAAAAETRFALQSCTECGALQYPPRDACRSCLGTDLPWVDADPAGTLLAETTVRHSTKLYFRERVPWRMGSVQLDAGPVVLCHLHPDVTPRARVRMTNRLDRAGQGVLIALPQTPTPHMQEAPIMRAVTSDPKLRRVLITDARAALTPALTRALLEAGAATVFVGLSEAWRGPLPQIEGAEVLPLDVTDTASVQKLAGEIGGKVDILINTARFLRPGGVLARGDTGFAATEMEVNAMGLMRLAQAFGPGMCGRTGDGVNNAVAWVNILDAHALSPDPAYGSFGASQAAARAIALSLRGEFRASGLRVMNAYVGPTEEDWFAPLPPPKVAPKALARDIVAGLQDGAEDIWCGDVARDLRDRWRADAKVLERELTMGGDAP